MEWRHSTSPIVQRIRAAGCLLPVEVLVDVEPGFAGFVRANTPALLRTAYLLTGSGLAAEELVQDTLARLYPKWDKVEHADIPIAYVRRSLANAFINDRRRAAYREYAVDALPERFDPHDQVDQMADRDEIWMMLRTLPARQRAALVMRFFHDLPDDEIALALDCRPGTVRSLISRGLASMRAQSSPPPAPAPSGSVA
jgi:RNA polymerase sigma-70 factor (sigma-E family)